MAMLLGVDTSVRRKVFLSYHHGSDQAYYEVFSRTFHDALETITDNSLERAVDSENVDYVMRRIRDSYIAGTSCTIVLVGAGAWGRKYIDWEIKATLEKGHGLIGVHLPTLRSDFSGKVTVPSRLHDNIDSGYAVWTRWADIASSHAACRDVIESANSRDRNLIRNTRERRLRNAS